MNSLQIEQTTPQVAGAPVSYLRAQRDHMRKAFNAWLKRPTNSSTHQALHNLMVDYELGARLREVFPLHIQPTSV